jgi:unsaturated chondroitin disaccharide hydrolase
MKLPPLILKTLLTFFLACLSGKMLGQKQDREMEKMIRENFLLAAQQYKLLAKNTPAAVMPRNYVAKESKLVTSNTSWWTSGFFPGSLWYIYEYTKDTAIRAEAERRLGILEKEKYHSKDHDLGFMIFCSFGNAYRITANPAYKETVLTAAGTLAKRYRPSIRSIQSWDSNAAFRCPVIVDNMMNLELLCWASAESSEPNYKVIAVDHANTTLKNHYRPDHSSYHVVDYDLATGTVARKKTAQGFSDESAWARGQSWGLYGFVVMYRFTKDPVYLEQAKNIAAFLLKHPNLPKDKIPYWDYDAPAIPNTYRDVSSASILASALLELGLYAEKKEKNEYMKTARTILQSLSGNEYRNKQGENGGFILKHSVGGLPFNSEVDVPLTYADYYFLEALLRYRKWYLPAVKE